MFFGLPAVGVFAGILGIAIYSRANTSTRPDDYYRRGLVSMSQGNWKEAELFFTRARDSQTLDPREIDFGLAIVWERQGYLAKSLDMLRRLAPTDVAGFPKAHQHLAFRMFSSTQGVPQDNDYLRTLGWHLRHAEGQETAALQRVWGDYYVAVNDRQSAAEAYGKAAVESPELYIKAAELWTSVGQNQRTKTALDSLRADMERQVRDQPMDRRARVLYGTALLFQGEFALAEQVLRTGMQLDPEGPYAAVMVSLHVRIHDFLRQNQPENRSAAMQQLQAAFELDPANSEIYRRLMLDAVSDPTAIAELKKKMLDVLANGDAAPLAHLALSNLAFLERDTKQAIYHLEEAFKLNPRMPAAANNLAWQLAEQAAAGDPILDRALELVERAIEGNPNEPAFVDTRAAVLEKMGRYEDAVTETMKVMPRFKNKLPLHERLSRLYREMGMKELSEVHEEKALELRRSP